MSTEASVVACGDECCVCCDDSALLSLDCGHTACVPCWSEYFRGGLREKRDAVGFCSTDKLHFLRLIFFEPQLLTCMGIGCKNLALPALLGAMGSPELETLTTDVFLDAYVTACVCV